MRSSFLLLLVTLFSLAAGPVSARGTSNHGSGSGVQEASSQSHVLLFKAPPEVTERLIDPLRLQAIACAENRRNINIKMIFEACAGTRFPLELLEVRVQISRYGEPIFLFIYTSTENLRPDK